MPLLYERTEKRPTTTASTPADTDLLGLERFLGKVFVAYEDVLQKKPLEQNITIRQILTFVKLLPSSVRRKASQLPVVKERSYWRDPIIETWNWKLGIVQTLESKETHTMVRLEGSS